MGIPSSDLPAIEARLAANRRKDAKAGASHPASGIRHQEFANEAERESELHREIMRECQVRGWFYFRGSMAHRTYRTVGEPDFIICLPNGCTLYIEAKSRAGKLSAEQGALHTWLAKLGHTVHVVRSIEAFRAVTEPIKAAEELEPDPLQDELRRMVRALTDMAEDRDWPRLQTIARGIDQFADQQLKTAHR